METLKYPKETKAIKEHRCDFCNDRIGKGSVYLNSTHVSDGVLYGWKTHTYCYELASKLKMYEDCDEGVTEDYFREVIDNVHDDLLISMLPKDEPKKYSDIIQQIRRVEFRHKLYYVLSHIDEAVKNVIK